MKKIMKIFIKTSVKNHNIQKKNKLKNRQKIDFFLKKKRRLN